MLPILFGWLLFLLLVWLPVESAVTAYCFNNYDLGIYAQALALLSPREMNPFLSTREVYLFNDHFDPILFLVAPFRYFVRPEILAIRAEMIAVLAASLAPLWMGRRGLVTWTAAICGFLLILFSPLTLDALFYPAHPGTWSLAPLAWLFAFLLAEKYCLAIVMLLAAMGCKEEFPAVGFVIGAVLFWFGRKRQGVSFMLVSALWGCLVFLLRPILLGKSDFYTNAVLGGSGLGFLGTGSGLRQVGSVLLIVFGPLLLLNGRLNRELWRLRTRPEFSVAMASILMLLLVRLMGGYWGNHRAAPLAVAGTFLILGSGLIPKASHRRIAMCGLLVLFFSFPSLELGSRVWRGKPFKKHCPTTEGRMTAINNAVSYLEGIRAERVLASGNLVPRLVNLPGVAQVGASSGSGFRFFLVEKNPLRNTWPITSHEFAEIENEWRSKAPNVREVVDDDYLLLLESVK